MEAFRLIVVVDGMRTEQATMPFDHVPRPGETIETSEGRVVVVRHVIEAQRHGVSGIILAWAA